MSKSCYVERRWGSDPCTDDAKSVEAQGSESVESEGSPLPALDFREWFARNHPFDWWASERDGEPLPERDRQLVRELCRRAFEASGERTGE